MANEIKLKRGSGSDPSASDLVVGEVALRTDNGTLFTKKDDGSVAEIGAAAGVSDGDKGDITVSNSGATFTIDSGVISNGNVASNAAIAGSKISPDFGSQNIATTGGLRLTNTSLTTSGSADELVIGTTSGNRGLTIFSGTSNTGNIFFGDTDTSGTGNRMGTITYDHSGNFMRFSTNGNQERIRIDSSGNVGIGTSNPTDLVDILNTTNNSRFLRLSHPTAPTEAAGFLGFNSDGSTNNNVVTFGVQYSSSYYNVLNIKRSTQAVGIGTVNPSTALDVNGTITCDDVVTAGALLHEGDTNTLVHFDANDQISLKTNGSTRLQVTNSGAAVTGVITSTGKVQAGDDVEVTVSSGDAFIVTQGGTNQGHLVKKTDGTICAAITNGGAVSGSADDCAIFSSSGNVRILAGGNNISNDLILNVTTGGIGVTGDMSITGTITASGDITANGGDITISGTSPILHLVDTNDNPNYRVQNVNGVFQIYDATSDVSRFNVATNGLVSVPADFDVNGTLSVTSTAPQIELVDSNANSDFRLKCNSGSFHIEDITNAGNRLSIDSSGDVIIHNDLDFPDSSKIKFGASDDLTITHDGSHSRISDTGTGSIKIETDSAVHINKGTSENMAKFIVDGQVELYFDNSKKLSTASDGITVTGRIVADELDMGDDDKVKLGTGDDFELFHNGSQNIIGNTATQLRIITDELRFRSATGSETYGQANVNGGFELHHNNVKKFETTSTGATITGDAIIDAVKIGAWSGGSTYKGIFHSSQSSSEYMMINNDGHTFISATGSHNVYIRNGANDSTNQLIVASGSDGLTWRGSKVFHAANLDITSDTSPVLGGNLSTNGNNIGFADNDEAIFGNGSDLTIKHNGTNSFIDNNTGDFYLQTTGSGDDIIIQSNDDILLEPQAGENGIKVIGNGAVEAYFDNVLKVKTQTDHINIGCNLSSNPFDYLRFGASLFGAADIAPHNAGSHTVGISFRTDSTADTTINPTEALRLSANGAFGPPNNLTELLGASDMRLKKNIVNLDKGLSAINSLRPVSFNWTDGFCDEQTETLYGFIAQEVQTIDSNLIYQFGSDGKVTFGETTIENALTVKEKFIIPMLVKAVQELTAKVTALES